MDQRESFSPQRLLREAKRSGFFQCPKCGLVWFGLPEAAECPEPSHGRAVHVVIVCRTCDEAVPIEDFVTHLTDGSHMFGAALNIPGETNPQN